MRAINHNVDKLPKENLDALSLENKVAILLNRPQSSGITVVKDLRILPRKRA